MESGDKVTYQAASTCSTECLHGRNAALLQRDGIAAVCELNRSIDVRLHTRDTSIFVIIPLTGHCRLSLTYGWEYVGLVVSITVGSDAEAHLTRVHILLEFLSQSKDLIRGS